VLPLEAGKERAVAATETYLNSVGAVALPPFATIREDDVSRAHEPNRLPEVLEVRSRFARVVPVPRRVPRCGRGGRSSRCAVNSELRYEIRTGDCL